MEQQLLEFAGNHTLLVAAFMAVLTALIWNLVTDPGGKNAVDPLTATAMINHDDAIVLDVRSMAELVFYRVGDNRTLKLICMMREVFCTHEH